MKTVDDFWKIIGIYNLDTFYIQGLFSLFIIGILIFSFIRIILFKFLIAFSNSFSVFIIRTGFIISYD